MRKMTIKKQRTIVITALLAVSFLIIGMIYTVNNRQNTTNDLQANEVNNEIQVDAVDAETENVEVVEVEEMNLDGVVVQELEQSDTITITNPKVQEETVEEPMAVQPEKPVNTPPDKTPQTTDSVDNTEKVPEYSEEETTYTPEEPLQEEKPVDTGTKEDSNLVPDSQNPFLNPNIPSNGDDGEMKGSDYYQDGVPAGEGDKF